ncbi:hypothetical protein ACM614_17360, partial [Streptomyces sp. 12297]
VVRGVTRPQVPRPTRRTPKTTTPSPTTDAPAATVDVRGAIGFSSFGVLVYYAIANASAWALDSAVTVRAVAAVGLSGCVLLACALPVASVLAGASVVGLGVVVFGVRRVGRGT